MLQIKHAVLCLAGINPLLPFCPKDPLSLDTEAGQSVISAVTGTCFAERLSTTSCDCLLTEKVRVTEIKSTVATSMKGQFGIDKSEFLFIYWYVFTLILVE